MLGMLAFVALFGLVASGQSLWQCLFSLLFLAAMSLCVWLWQWTVQQAEDSSRTRSWREWAPVVGVLFGLVVILLLMAAWFWVSEMSF